MKAKKIFFSIILIFSFLLINCKYGYADAISSSISKQKSKLYNITKDIKKKKYKLKQLTRQEKNTLRKLAEIERQLRIGGDRLNRLRRQLANVYKDVCKTQRSVYSASYELNKRQNILLRRLKAIFKYRAGEGVLGSLLNTDNFADISKRLYFMTLIAKADTELIKEIKRKKNTYLQRKKILQSKYNKISKIKKSQQRLLNKQKRLKKDRQRLLSKIRSKKSLYQRQIAKLERDSLEIKRLIKRLEAKKLQAGKYILRGRGDLPWPVKNRKLYRGFGRYKHPKFDAYIVNKGIDILAAEGETVTSIKEGKVVFANWFRGYGMLVIIDHGKGLYSLYAHLAKILVSVGEKVSQGSPIGKVGSPFGGDKYNLHFEIRVNGEPVDPLDWLKRG